MESLPDSEVQSKKMASQPEWKSPEMPVSQMEEPEIAADLVPEVAAEETVRPQEEEIPTK